VGTGNLAMRRSWIVTALFLLMFGCSRRSDPRERAASALNR